MRDPETYALNASVPPGAWAEMIAVNDISELIYSAAMIAGAVDGDTVTACDFQECSVDGASHVWRKGEPTPAGVEGWE